MKNFMSTFSFELPTGIVFGPGCIKELANELQKLGVSRPLIVTDSGIVKAGILDKVTAFLPKTVEYSIFDGVEPNPKDKNVSSGAKAYKEFNADCVLAIGGGSSIDCAKSIGVLVANDASDIKPFEGKNKPSKPLPPIVCVPTTSGTGSELTFSSVITDTKNDYKMTIKNQFTAPRLAICDPELTLTCPPEITAACGVDALTHAIEAFTVNCSEPISDAVALYAIELIYANLLTCVNDGNNIEARSRMLMGSMLGGIAFSHSDVASVHCIAEALGGMYDLPHGTCNAIFLSYMMEYCMEYCEDHYARVARAMGATPDTGRAGAEAAVNAVKQLAKDVRLPSFADLNVDPDDFDKIAEISAKNISTDSNPRPMAKEDYLAVLNMAIKG